MAIEQQAQVNKNAKTEKKPKRDKTDLGPDFVAPDGGWAWVVCVASGFSTFCVFPAVQQYGIIYRQRMYDLGFNAKQITTILNGELAIAALFGIISGAAFRRFTYRRIGILGGVLVALGVLLTAYCQTFVEYVICFSCIYGIGLGMNLSATALAVNTYFKKYRRRAMGFNSTIVGLGPMVSPHACTFLLQVYGTQGTVLIVAAIALNSAACCCTLQPVLWHIKKVRRTEEVAETLEEMSTCAAKEQATSVDYECKYCRYQRDNERSILPTQYIFNEDDAERPGYEVTESGMPMLARGNDGWFGSKTSLAAESTSRKLSGSFDKDSKANYFNREREDRLRYTSKSSLKNLEHCTCAEERALLKQSHDEVTVKQADEAARSKMSFKQKVIQFFDLDLLRDLTFLNLIQGMTIMMFTELNFSFLTPFILASYGYTNSQISFAMSSLATMDIIMRFTLPFALEKVKFSNSALFAFGIIILLTGRCLVVLVDSFYTMLAVFLLLGFGKAFRTIFAPLIIPSYVPLDRLAAASGLQLFLNSIFTMAVGPVLGVITDLFDYNTTIHFMNLMTIFSLSLWGLEWIVHRWLGKSRKTRTAEK